ncbi:hypothetical protein GX48_04838 [Paracoccidioides brasiliensis]|nr:hypothetical protein GX48_04838 [Paracoccidioides brasiliensis]
MVSTVYLRRRILPLAITLLFAVLALYLLQNHDYIYEQPTPGLSSDGHEQQVAVVVAGLRSSNTKWLRKSFPHWDTHIYIANDESSKLRIPKNKGREAMVYLTHIIDHYDDYRDDAAILFLHADQDQWHNDDEKYDGKRMLQRFSIPHLVREGYVNMRCHPYPGCTTGLDLTTSPAGENSESATIAGFLQNFATLFPNSTLPKQIAVGCCAQFGVTAGTIRQNSRERYVLLRQWLLDTALSDHISGRLMEYMWHILFGKPARHCPDPQQCYCEVYGRCNLNKGAQIAIRIIPAPGGGSKMSSSTAGQPPQPQSSANSPTYFEQQREELVREIALSLEQVLQNINCLNRNLESVITVGNEFSSVEALWSQFETVMGSSNENENEHESENALHDGGGDGGGNHDNNHNDEHGDEYGERCHGDGDGDGEDGNRT